MYPTYKNRKEQSRAGGYVFLGPKSNTPIQEMPLENGPVHLECRIMINLMALATESDWEVCLKTVRKQLLR